ncbi:hypothetical protein BS78_09G097500 [Paspalum vaginatum]|nr:hypothetical protein BS78_09G097500 [Paspalum vaginatum]
MEAVATISRLHLGSLPLRRPRGSADQSLGAAGVGSGTPLAVRATLVARPLAALRRTVRPHRRLPYPATSGTPMGRMKTASLLSTPLCSAQRAWCSRSAPPVDTATPESSPGRSPSQPPTLPSSVDVPAALVEAGPEGLASVTTPTPLTTFIGTITCPATWPLPPKPHQGQYKQRKMKKLSAVPTRRSKRLAAIAWLHSDVQDRARQVLMERLGVLPEAEKPDEAALQRFLDLFKGLLTALVLQALSALCGLQSPQMQPTLAA